MPQCKNCGQEFIITEQDRSFYNRINVPEPQICWACRRQRRLAWRNERVLYRRKCDLCQTEMVSLYPENNPTPIYCHECWWSDKWGGADYAQDFDFSQPFFEQFSQLIKNVPRLTIINSKGINSDFCNYSYANKNCYLTIGCHYEEDCFYNDHSTKNHSCLELARSINCELSCNCVDSAKCYQCSYLDFCKECNNCHFCYNCSGCHDCFLSSDQLNQKYVFKNKQLTPHNYQQTVGDYLSGSYQQFERAQQEYLEIVKNTIKKYTHQVYCVDCVGDDLVNCKNLRYCFDATGCADCAYGVQMDEQYDSRDNDYMGYDRSEVCLETIGCSGVFNCYFCDSCWHDHHLQYSNLAFGSNDCFGCVGIKNQKYCILNKQYSEDEYKKLLSKVIDHLKKTGEYGWFFPLGLSPYGYNATVNMEPYNQPLNKVEVSELGSWWQENTPGTFGKETINQLPDNIGEVGDNIIKEILACANCHKNFKIITQELELYKKLNLPLPRLCPDCRYFARIKRRQPRQLYLRQCMCSKNHQWHQGKSCPNKFETVYSPTGAEQLYCAECYRQETY
ncbi:MAG: zinc-ribbon domain containing protein [Patescibacteria group bacterium]